MKSKVKLLQDLTMLVLDIYPKELKVGIYTDTCMYNSIHCGIIYHR